jgi:hypothetical protein
MAKRELCVMGVANMDACNVVEFAYKTVGVGRSQGLNAVALLLCAAELAVLVSEEDWCLLEDKCVTIETLRNKARDSASRVFLQFKNYRAS